MRIRKRGRSSPAAVQTADGFADFYERHSHALLAFFARRVLDPEVALDLTAETFAQALLGRRRFRGDDDDDALAWLFGIARHQLSQYWRRGATEKRALARLGVSVPALSQVDFDRVEELAASARLRAAAQNGLMELSENVRAAIRLRIVEELPYAEVARQLAISEDAARARVSRGLRTLAARLGDPSEEGDEP
jgi:RNA polymerase sigma factor (sigma-70 family)